MSDGAHPVLNVMTHIDPVGLEHPTDRSVA
jgi:hypothetical protein